MARMKLQPDIGKLDLMGAHEGGAPVVVVYVSHRDGAGAELRLTPEEALDLAAKIPAAIKDAEQAVRDIQLSRN